MKLEDILDSDQRILAHSTRTTEGGKSLLVFDFGGTLGKLSGVLPEKLDASILTEWCTAVRREYNARTNVEAPAKAGTASTVRSAPDAESARAGEPGGGGVPAPADLQGAQAALEAGIQSSLVEVRRRIESCHADLDGLEKKGNEIRSKLAAAEELEAYYNGLLEKVRAS